MHTSLKKFSRVLKQEGTSRQERYVPALHESTSLLDGRKLQDFILYMQQYSKNLLFVNTDDEPLDYAGSWEDFFADDPVLLIAGIASTDTKKVKEEYDHLNDIFQEFSTIGNFVELVKFVFSRFIQVNNWYALSPEDSMLYHDLHLYIRSYLQKEIESVREMILYCFDHQGDDAGSDKKAAINTRNDKTRNELQSMHTIWKLDQKEKLTLREKIFSGADEKAKLINASVILNKIFETIFYATETIAEKSGKYFDETIHQKQNHNAHVGLIITFIKLFEYEQAELNKIPQRLLSFYYRNVLRIKEKEAVPDKTFIVAELAKGFDTCLVKKATKLSAGKDKLNHELVYETDKDVVLNKAAIAYLYTGFIERNYNGETLNYYTGIVTPTPGQVSAASPVAPAKIFARQRNAVITEIGFAIASSQFFLAKGERNIVLLLHSENEMEPLETVQGKTETTDFDTSIIRLLLTGEKGWISSETEDNGITINWLKKVSNTALELSFSISIAQEQAIIAFDKKLHDGNFNSSFPIMKCILQFPPGKPLADTTKQVHQLNILQQMRVTGANISVKVGSIQNKASFDGVRDLILENDEAAIDNKKPFFPFTPVPKVSSSFYIGCSDLFYKKMQYLSINIEWLLPDNFRAYYQKYHPPYDANKFMASMSILEKNRWKKYSDISVIDVNTSDPRFRTIKINFDKAKAGTDTPDDGIPSFNNSKKNGSLRLKLRYPDFGHSIYPQLITSTVMDKATSKSGNIDFYKLVKKKLHDDIFTIKLPPDINERNGSLKVMYDILEKVGDNAQAKVMLINALSDIISRSNDVEVVAKKPGQPVDVLEDKGSQVIVHDQNLIEKVFRFFRKINVLSDEVHHDKDKQDVEDVEKSLEKDIYEVADFILPSRKEMNNLIVNEVNKNINQTVANAVDLILEDRAETNTVDIDKIAKILDAEFDKARKVINDMIAKKIAIFLSANEIPPPPYSPLINTISLNYASSKDLSRLDDDKLFHLTMAGGITETSIWQDENPGDAAIKPLLKTDYLLPRLLSAKSEGKDVYMQGMLFIGISSIVAGQNISFLFQLAEGTKNNDQEPPALFWFYLRGNEWISLKKDNIISDSTHELQTTGIIEFSMPTDADDQNTFFNTSAHHWLCAAVGKDADAFPFLTDVKAQAVGVTFIDYRKNPQHLALPLEAEKIKKSIDEIPAIKKISQPVSSFNGKLGEKENEYYIRVSERLRHKSRAINNWDYESLVLENFPAIFKVKCLNNYYNGHFAVGHVTVVPIADLRNRNYAGNNMLIPKTNYIDLKRIEEFLMARSSPFVKIHAINPKLEQVLIRCKVKFYPGVDKGFFLNQLNEDLVEFLTPWATDAGKLSFSAKVYSSSIINFIDKREYVDYVADLVMLQYTEDEKGKKEYVFNESQLASLVETQLTSDHSILVSAPKHQVELVE